MKTMAAAAGCTPSAEGRWEAENEPEQGQGLRELQWTGTLDTEESTPVAEKWRHRIGVVVSTGHSSRLVDHTDQRCSRQAPQLQALESMLVVQAASEAKSVPPVTVLSIDHRTLEPVAVERVVRSWTLSREDELLVQ